MGEDLECLCQIMRTVGPRLDHEKAKVSAAASDDIRTTVCVNRSHKQSGRMFSQSPSLLQVSLQLMVWWDPHVSHVSLLLYCVSLSSLLPSLHLLPSL